MKIKNREKVPISMPCYDQTVIFTVDVEDYFMSPESIPFEDWGQYQPAIHLGLERTLALLEKYQAKATFFFVGWLAETYPELVDMVASQGHEIGSHGYTHKYVHEMEETEFEESLKKSVDILSTQVPREQIIGFRAPAFSLDRNKPWQFALLAKYGFQYDSSINPVQNYLYGDRHAPRHPYWMGAILEIPPAAVKMLGRTVPVGGGGTLRLLPERLTRLARKRYQAERFPPVIYMHPWEMVPEHPKITLPLKQHWMHYIGLRSFRQKVDGILQTNQAITMQAYYASNPVSK